MKTSRNMTNLEVAKLLRSVAAALTVKPGGPSASSGLNNRFRIIAYERAADAIEHATSEVKDLWEEDKLREVAGIGEAIAEHLDELFKTGKVKYFEDLMKGLPPAMFELLDVPGIGAKRAMKLTKELGITKAHGALERLQRAAEKGHIKDLPGFGKQSETEVLASVKEVKERTRRLLLPHAASIAQEVLIWLRKNPAVKRAEPLGSLRREASTVGDIDIAVSTNKPKEVMAHFGRYPKKVKLIEAGDASSSMLLPGGVQVDLMVEAPEAFGALLQHFTGSKHHNVALRVVALKKGLSLSEHGIKKLKTQNSNGKSTTQNSKLHKFPDEEGFYKFLGLDWIPPELREGRGEIEAALKHNLPKLVELKDIRGDFHIHSNFPPETSHDTGADPMVEYVAEAERLGYEYICFSEHNLKVSESEKKILDVLKRKKEKVEQINYSLPRRQAGRGNSREKGVRKVFNSLEIDIRPDGSLALPEAGFEFIDFAIVSIHGSFRATREEQTKRVLRALSHPKVRILGHPTGRKLNEREGVDFDWERIFEFCKANNKWLEINSWPERLDLPDILVHEAVKRGVKLTIDTDSHAVSQMRGMRYGVSVARRGWTEKKDIINTLPLEDFLKELQL